ncbi:MAG TPA: hypothetical protein VK809_08195 [Bacteroidia bacterium]|nr:hypothetical protein [Bacteroidia bacterium]
MSRLIGKYKGYYKYDNYKFQKFDKTYFTIEITHSDVEKNFYGCVEDDLSSGGMPGIGDIHGSLKEGKILFIKSMPYQGVFIESDSSGRYELQMDKSKRHQPIYYEGKTLPNGKYGGKWNFRHNGMITQIIIWLKGIKTGGTWEMSKVKE